MFDYSTVKLLHQHGDGAFSPMTPSVDHDAAAHDPERAWLAGAQIFRCSTCDDQVVLVPPSEPGEEVGG